MNVPSCVFCSNYRRKASPINVKRNCYCVLHGIYLPYDMYPYIVCSQWKFIGSDKKPEPEKWRRYVQRVPLGYIEVFKTEYDDFSDRKRILITELESFE